MLDTTVETRDYTGVTTKQIITEMLLENTGRGLCDSGDAYGRNWQRNQGKDFAAQPKVKSSWSTWRKEGEDVSGKPEIDTSISLHHWMAAHLKFDAEMQSKLEAFAQTEEMQDECWLGIQEQFADQLQELEGHVKAPNVINTYNGDSWSCSQGLQYVEVYADSDYEPSHLIISVHGGCDVRGGYTEPKCFKLVDEYWTALGNAEVKTIYCDSHYWDFGNGCSSNDCSEDAPVRDIFTLPCYDTGWFDDAPPLKDIQEALARIPLQRGALDNTTLDAGQRVNAIEALDRASVELEQARFDAVWERVQAVYCYATFTLIHNQSLFLIVDGDLVGEVTAEVNF